MAANSDDLAYFKRGRVEPEAIGKVGTQGLDYFKRGEAFSAVLIVAAVATATLDERHYPRGVIRGALRGVT